MSKKKNKKLLIILLIAILVIGTTSVLAVNKLSNKKSKIDRILLSKNYNYLPKQARNYIKEVYIKTGNLILTEKNKKKGEPYLNPKYAVYLSLNEEEKNETSLIPNVYVIDFSPSDNYKESKYPETYNISSINNESYITPMKNQGSLGLCWSFATIEQAESYLMLKNKTPYNSSSEIFSVRQMDYATSNNGIKNYENENGYRALTSGGNFYMSSMIISNGLSLTPDTYMPYNSDESKKDLIDVLNYSNSKYELNSTIMMPYISDKATSQDKEAFNNVVKGNIINYGGAYVGTGSPNGNCGFKNTDNTYTIVDSDNCIGASGHAMQIIGWDDNYNYSYCKSGSNHSSVDSSGNCSSGSLVNGTGAWILRNSWGDDTDSKFVYLAYESNGLDIDFTTSLTSASEKKWDNNYHKNLWVNGTSDKKSDTSIFYKKINTSEKIKMIKFLSASVDGEFSVSVKSGNNRYNNIKTVHVEYPGIYTIDLSNDNIMLDDSQFSVTIESTNDSYFVENSISAFTSNTEKTPQIVTENIDGSTIKINSDSNYEFIVYSSTKNIPSNQEVTYSLLKDNADYSNYIISTVNNKVAENNINATIVLNNSIPNGTYTLRVSYNDSSFDSTLIIPNVRTLSGEGTENSPYLIYTEDDLNQIRFNPDSYYLLKNDITLTENWNPIGTAGNPFRGGFDGGNHKIKRLNINQNSEDAVGFFGYVNAKYNYDMQTPTYLYYREKSYIKNITFENPTVSNDGMAGILIGKLVFNPTDAPETAFNIGSPIITIDNVHFIEGHVVSNTSDAGVIAANLNVIPKSWSRPYMHMNNIFSSTTISGYHSAGIVGFINDSFESASGIMLEFDLKNFQNVGIIDQSNFNISYSDENNYSPVVGGIYGNAEIILENFIINSTFDNSKYMSNFKDSHSSLYVLGSYDKKASKYFTYELTNGYYVSKYFTSPLVIKDIDFSSKWADFDTYWKIETIDGIKRIPVLKNISYSYKELPNEITLKLYDETSLLEYLNESFKYISYNVVKNDNIIDIKGIDIDGDRYFDDYVINAKQKGKATIHVINYFDGIEKDIVISVDADKVDKPIITYYYNGEYNNESYTQQVNASEAIKLTKNKFTRAGFTFDGWNTIKDGSGMAYNDEDIIASGIDENLRLYGQWTAKKYTLSFDANGGIGTMDDWTNISLCERKCALSIPTNKYKRAGYKFVSWNTKKDGTGASFDDSGTISFEQLTSIDGLVMTLYAQWVMEDYTIKFEPNTGTGKMNEQDSKTNDSNRLSKNLFTKDGYKFDSWNTKPDGTGSSYKDEDEIVNIIGNDKEIILYAQWSPISYIVKFDSNGGTGKINNMKFTYDTSSKLSKNVFKKDGYKFKEWNTKPDGTGISYKDEENVKNLTNKENEEVTLYAIWEFDGVDIKGYEKDNNELSNIKPSTTLSKYKENVKATGSYKIRVFDNDNKELSDNDLIFTGSITKVYKDDTVVEEYINIVKGDTDGDGEATTADAYNIVLHSIGKKELKGIYFKAGLIDSDEDVTTADAYNIVLYSLGKKENL